MPSLSVGDQSPVSSKRHSFCSERPLVTPRGLRVLWCEGSVLSDNCESRNNHRYAVVVQDLATQWIQAHPCKTKLNKKPREACKSSWNPKGNQKSFTLTIPWNSAKLVKIFPGIIARLHHTDRRLMVLRKEQCAE